VRLTPRMSDKKKLDKQNEIATKKNSQFKNDLREPELN